MSYRGQGQHRGATRGGGPSRGRGGPPGQGGSSRGRGGGSDASSTRGGSGYRGGGGGGGFGRGAPTGPIIFQQNIPAQVPARLSDTNLSSLVSSFGSLRVSAPERPLRPGFGTAGRPITLRANFFAVKIAKGQQFWDYVVSISGPRATKEGIKIRVFELLELHPQYKQHASYIAHDKSQRLVSARKLPQPLIINIKYFDEGKTRPDPGADEYVVELRLERVLDTNELNRYLEGDLDARTHDLAPVSSALNLISQSYAVKHGTRVGRTFPKYFYDKPTKPVALGANLEAWQGFALSIRPAFKQLMVNVNVCMSAFVTPGNLADILFQFSRNSRGAMPTLPPKMVKSIKVRTKHLGHKKKLYQVMSTSARNTYFLDKDKRKISVEQFFKSTHNITLQYPAELPVVNIGTKQKAVYVPAELCIVEPGNAFRGRLTDQETASMIKCACNPPHTNAESIVNIGFPSLGLSSPNPQQPQASSPLGAFGISIDNEMTVIPGRVLPPPGLNYKVGNARVANGSWNILDVKFHRGATVASWCVLVIRDGRSTFSGPDDTRLTGLIDGFANKLRRSGMTIPNPRPAVKAITLVHPGQEGEGRERSLDVIRGVMATAGKPSFILVLLENRDNAIYPGLKRIGDVELGIHTLCMQLGKALGDQRKQDQYFSNVALKLNTKLGGVNHQLDEKAMRWLKKTPTMMVGIDVTHAGPTSRSGTPSIAAVVANTNDTFAQFPASMRIQAVDPNKESKEMVDELRDMMVERLLLYEKKSGKLPQRVFVFRDGVSEGQFDIVLREELPEILKAFERMGTQGRPKYRPKLSIIICGKRHHARFFPTDSQFAVQNGNTLPGTVVDKGVTAVFDFDFYLQPHNGLQGTVKATHYTVIYDENVFGADEIQTGTHDFSYLYARATKAVSLIPPAYYADLACERGRCYLNEFMVSGDYDRMSSVGGKKSKEEEKAAVFEEARKAWGNGLHANVKDSMFYI
ncbi:argonaute-like protein [Macrolepiota fuliginosa MF-IS2]|uniref:Argonaute-like protein n=1 Tax=Macrolepiota fuliginosa MF-IS2 TaxID=1400762 RepID=A0A9P5X1G8_9AGAR|nr:argonaute-like protein [Macrolepiota fuliginosa MF-IS2]